MKALVVALAVTYPFLAHYALATGREGWLVASVVVLLLAVLLPGIVRGSKAALALAVVAAVALFLMRETGQVRLALFIPPVAITAGLAALFGGSLRRGRVPLIQKLVLAMHPPDDPDLPDIRRYTRNLTAIWAAFLALLSTTNLVLALFAAPGGILSALGLEPPVTVPIETWSLFANFIGYALIAALFVVEYAVRRRFFPRQPYRNFADFMQKMARVAPAVFRS